ncbi:MAG TPA: hypothetical protein VND65_19090, partial [Candidatus Binatia bacterium]|nr:hypothetical protein [Candidatus Binatia bacterium]
GAALQSQHNLIQVLQRDSLELWGEKGRAITAQHRGAVQAQKNAQAEAQTQAQGQAQAQAQNKTKHSQASKGVKPDAEVPPVPASDWMDQRRSLHTI